MSELVSFKEVLKIYKRLFSVDDTSLLEIILSHYISHKLEKRDPVWLFIIAPSSFGKTLHIKALEDFSDVYLLTKITPRTLITGMKNQADEVLNMDKKLLLVPDFSQFLNLHPQEKTAIWSQFRDLYDGYASAKFGSGKNVEYRDLYVSLLACTTPDIENQITLFQQLGTRHISFRADYWVSRDYEYLLNDVSIDYIEKQYKNTVQMFFEGSKFNNMEIPKLDKDVLGYIKKLTEFVTLFRTDVKVDSFTGEPIGFSYPENPDRVFNMFRKMLKSYLILSDGNIERGKELIKKLAFSCVEERRLKVFKSFKDFCYVNGILDDTVELTINKIANYLKLGLKTVKSQLYGLAQLGLIDFTEENSDYRVLKWYLTQKGEEWLKWF